MSMSVSCNLIFDSHAHYCDESFDADRDRLLAGLCSNGVGNVVEVSATLADIPRVCALSEKYDLIYAAAGIHPSEANDMDESWMKAVSDAALLPKTVAIGEIGLDYHYDDINRSLQKKWFADQIALALEKELPIIIHSRDAAADTLDIVRSEKARDAGGVVHCFSYGKDMAREYLDLGFYIGIGGVLTFKNARKLIEVAEYAPLDRLLLETDCPYMTPVPHRGERNDSTMIKYVAAKLAEIKNKDIEEIIGVTAANATAMYRIDQRASLSGTEKMGTEFSHR
jgi:TatD DNase family protein